MDIYELTKKSGAEMVANKVILNVENKRSILARAIGGEWKLTEDGEALAEALEESSKKKTLPKKPAQKQDD